MQAFVISFLTKMTKIRHSDPLILIFCISIGLHVVEGDLRPLMDLF